MMNDIKKLSWKKILEWIIMTVKSMIALWFLHNEIRSVRKSGLTPEGNVSSKMKNFYKYHRERVMCGTCDSSKEHKWVCLELC